MPESRPLEIPGLWTDHRIGFSINTNKFDEAGICELKGACLPAASLDVLPHAQ